MCCDALSLQASLVVRLYATITLRSLIWTVPCYATKADIYVLPLLTQHETSYLRLGVENDGTRDHTPPHKS